MSAPLCDLILQGLSFANMISLFLDGRFAASRRIRTSASSRESKIQ